MTSRTPIIGSKSESGSMYLDVGLVADLHPSRVEELSTDAEGQHTASGRHRVGVEIHSVELSTNPHLLEAAELSRDCFGISMTASPLLSAGRK